MALSMTGTDQPVTSSDNDFGGAEEIYGDYSVDDEDQPSNLEDLGDPDVDDPLDRGYSPPESYSAAQGFGNTPYEEAVGETLEQRVAQEIPEPDPYVEAERGDTADGVPANPEVGAERAGRLVAPDEGFGEDTEKDLVADDVGIDGAAASAEEAAMHVVTDDNEALLGTEPES